MQRHGYVNNEPPNTTYHDDLVLSNYVDGNYTVSDFYRMAKSYIDTTKADEEILSVTFVGQEPGTRFPTLNEDDDFSTHKYRLIAFGFDDDSTNKPIAEMSNLFSISTWIDGEHQIYWSKLKEDKKVIDSLLQSKGKYKTGF